VRNHPKHHHPRIPEEGATSLFPRDLDSKN
jgi:hypothetical protein